MNNLNEALDGLYELKDLRDRAKELRERGRLALKGIRDITSKGVIKPEAKEFNQGIKSQKGKKKTGFYETWIASGNDVESALLVKVQNHRYLSEDDDENDTAEASKSLKKKLSDIKFDSLFPSKPLDISVPVLVAARAMQALVGRAETVFSRATMICYYRIIRELYVAAGPDWTIGAARAGGGGSTSAFVTGECIRAILAFEGAIKRTVEFFRKTRELREKHTYLTKMLEQLPAGTTADHPLSKWANKAIERMWLDWFISTNPRRGEIALYYHASKKGQENALLPCSIGKVDLESVGKYLKDLPKKLEGATHIAKQEMEDAQKEIKDLRDAQFQSTQQKPIKNGDLSDQQEQKLDEANRRYRQTESAHQVSSRIVERGIMEVEKAEAFFNEGEAEILEKFMEQFERISRRLHRVLEPAKRYVRTVVDRELANSKTVRFDAGELAFAAASFGATTGWKPNDRLKRACELLIQTIPDSGRLPTKRPFHSTPKGSRLLPIGCEMTRSFAQLLQKTNYEFEPELVRQMLNLFEEKLLDELSSSTQSKRPVAWNFEGAPDQDKPCVWVTAVAVLSLDRIVRMLNERINAIVLKHFEVIRPEKPHTDFTLDDLIYPDYGLSQYRSQKPSIATRLEQMRAHIMRVTLPKRDKKKRKKENVFSVILYGPPGTGKTTLVESLALSSQAPLIRLSPSDLTVQGQELIEGRARSVFEALSMLTQAVILLDEFEPVLSRRATGEESKSDDKFNFLLTGMLPKLLNCCYAVKRANDKLDLWINPCSTSTPII
jgi:hypothetical protein